MPRTMDRMRTRICLLMAAMMFLAVSLYAATSEILILFDQSGSMRRYDSKLLSMIWLSTIVRTFKAPIRVTLDGFDYELHQHLSVVISGEAERSFLSGALNGIEASGPATDLEIPFRYLVDRGAEDSLKMMLIITDGEPEIWDKNLGFLSPRVLADGRYGDLNAQYRTLKASGLSEQELYRRMGAKYHVRNLELIERAVSLLGGEKGKKLVIWDISGSSEFLRKWAGLSNAVYMPLDTSSTSEPPIDALRGLLTATQKTASTLLEEPLPVDYSDRVDDALKDVAEALPTEQTAEQTAVGTLESEPEINEGQTQDAPLPGWSGNFAIALLMFAVVAFIIGLILYRRHKSYARPEIEGNDSAPGVVSSESVEEPIFEPGSDLGKKPVDKPGEEPEPDFVGDRPITDATLDKDEILSYIDQRIESALGSVEKFIGGTFSEMKGGLESDRRLSLRVKTPPGSIVVHWTDGEGVRGSANAINISMHGILFEAALCEADSIDYIEAAGIGVCIGVAHSTIKRRDAGKFVVNLLEFEREAEDRKTWVEIQTRIGEED